MNNSTTSTSTLLIANIAAPIGLLLVFAATAAPFVMIRTQWPLQWYPYVYAAGAVILLVARLMRRYRTNDERLRRLYRLERWAPVIFIVAVGLLFYNPTILRDWLAFTLAGAIVQIYTGFAIPARQKKLESA